MTSYEDGYYVVQFFLTPEDSPELGVFEVRINRQKTLACTCPGFKGKSYCKHVMFVANRMKKNGGEYPLSVAKRASKDAIKEAHKDPVAFREFLIMHGKVEVV